MQIAQCVCVRAGNRGPRHWFFGLSHHESIIVTCTWRLRQTMSDNLQRIVGWLTGIATDSERYSMSDHRNQKHDRDFLWLLRDDLHWLTIPRRVQYKLDVTGLFISVCGTVLRGTSPTAEWQSHKSPADNISFVSAIAH